MSQSSAADKKKVGIFTIYPIEGASSNFRILMYAKDLQKHFDVKCFSFWDSSYVSTLVQNKKKNIVPIACQYIRGMTSRMYQLLVQASAYDVVIFQKSVIPKLQWTMIDWLHRHGTQVIFDIDDSTFITGGDNADAIAARADLVIAGNDLLREHFLPLNPNTILMPTVDYTPNYVPFRNDTFDKKIVGWLGSKATVDNLKLVEKAMQNIVQRHPEVELHIISNSAGGFDQTIPNARLIPWTLDGYIRDMADFTIGIMPLYDTEYNRGKCGFKLIQYMNLLKPVIASDVGVNREVTGNGGTIASTAEEWEEQIEKMLFDEKSYRTYENNIRESFEQKYSYQNNLNTWIELIHNPRAYAPETTHAKAAVSRI